MKLKIGLTFVAGFATCIALLALVGAKGSATKAMPDRDVYFLATEDLKPDEMRVVACGTGMPNARPKQAAARTRSSCANDSRVSLSPIVSRSA